MPALEQAWNRLRVRVGGALGPVTASRHGWFYVARRTAVTWVERGLSGRPGQVPNESVDLAEVASRFPSVAVHPVVPDEHFPGTELRVGAIEESYRRLLARPWTARAQLVLEVPDGIALSPSGWAGIDDRHVFVTDAMTRWDLSTRHNRREADRDARGRVVHLPGRTVNLLQALVTNYSHSLIQGLPTIDFVDRAVGLDRVDQFLVRSTLLPYAYELLDRCGIGRDRLVVVPVGAPTRYRCDTLVATTYSHAGAPGILNAIEPVRRRFAPELELGSRDRAPRARWYVTRRAPSSRRVVNEDAVVAMLERRGFEPLVMDGRTVAEQAVLLARSECLVCVHGAAMTNIVFAAPGTPVIELMPRNWRVWSFVRLATAHGLPYDLVSGIEPAFPAPLYAGLVDADLVVDVDELAGRVDAALSRGAAH